MTQGFELLGVVTDVLERKRQHEGQRFEITLYDSNNMKVCSFHARSRPYDKAPRPGTRYGVAIVPEQEEPRG